MKGISILIFVLLFSVLCKAQENDNSANTTDAVIKQMAEEQKKLAEELKKVSEEQKKTSAELAKTKEDLQKAVDEQKKANEEQKKAVEEAKKPEEKKIVEFQPYGYIELAGWANDALFMANDLVLYTKDDKKSTTGLTAKGSRLGLKMAFPSIEAVKMLAQLEIDFVGNMTDSGAAEAQPMIRLRHAFFDISKTWGKSTIGLKAGQTWVTGIALVFPSLINQGAGWGFGNVWQRMPLGELYFNQKFYDLTAGINFGVVRAMTGASANRNSLLEVNIDAGDISRMPQFHGQAFLKGKISMFDLFLGVGGLYGWEDYSRANVNQNNKLLLTGDKVDVYLFNVGLKIAHKYANLSGKFYLGQNLDAFGVFGGSLIFDATRNTATASFVSDSQKVMGYWWQLQINPFEGIAVSTGMGSEDPDEKQTNSNPTYFENTAFWVEAEYTMFTRYTIALQWLQLNTKNYNTGTKDTAGLPIRLTEKGNSVMGSLKVSF